MKIIELDNYHKSKEINLNLCTNFNIYTNNIYMAIDNSEVII